MRILCTKHRSKEEFIPKASHKIKIYVCGPTVYDRIHLGNARPLVVFDVLTRFLRTEYPDNPMIYVRNITDIDDKIYKRAQERNISIGELTEETIATFHQDSLDLLCLSPDIEPRATEHIAEMIAIIETLLEKGHAYQAEGHVLFAVNSLAQEHHLIPVDRDILLEGGRIDVAPYKRDACDFVLWKPSGGDTGVTVGWDSPFGFGRPGWHIECSAMAMKYLGKDFDIHGGGCDLMFPHHFNENAQSCCAHPEHGFARYWMHNGYVTIQGEKMSKSLGNFYTVRELLEQYDGEVLRLALLMTHYHQPFDFTHELLIQAQAILDKFYQALRGLSWDDDEKLTDDDSELMRQFRNALADDLNTPQALRYLHEMAGQIHTAPSPSEKRIAAKRLKTASGMFGLLQRPAESWFAKDIAATQADEIERLIAQRDQARHNRDFKTADAIRDQLEQQGVILEDTGTQTLWKIR